MPTTRSCRTLAVVMDPISSLSYKKDTSLAMLWAASDAGYALFYLEPRHLLLRDGRAFGLVQPLQVFRDPASFYQLGELQEIPLAELDVILMRKDPPFDMNFVYATYILERAEQEGVLVCNRPASLRDCNEKLFATAFPQCCPPLVVSADPAVLRDFHHQHGDIVLKPLDGMGGRSIFRIRQDGHNLGVIIETLTEHGSRPVMAQRFLPAISEGDKRILMIDGVPVSHCLARIPGEGEHRGNLAAGGSGVVHELTERDRWIASQVGPELVRRGLRFVGLDVIGDWLTEVNVTSPTCLREIAQATGQDIAGQFIAAISESLDAARASRA